MAKGSYCSKHQVYHKVAGKYASCQPEETIKKCMDKAMKTSRKMCDLRQAVIDRAVEWEQFDTLMVVKGLEKVVRDYVKFQKRHFPEKKV